MAKNNLAVLLKQLGERDEARRLYVEVIEGRTELLGPSHPSTLEAKMNLANLLNQLGEWDEARQLYMEVAASRTEVFGASPSI